MMDSGPLNQLSGLGDPGQSDPSHLLYPAFALAIPLFVFIYKDYNDYLALGPGGTPSNFYGYTKITMLKGLTLKDPYCADPVPSKYKGTGHLKSNLPERPHSRPNVAGIAPHRQTDQRASQEVFDHLMQNIKGLAREHPQRLEMGISAFEKHCDGLFSSEKANPTGNGEVCHAHPIDGSMHMSLHPEDIEEVLKKGWGGEFASILEFWHAFYYMFLAFFFLTVKIITERHPLARGGFCSRFVPRTFVMIYSPQTTEEVEAIMQIVKAGFSWISGEKL
jgi:hypothetical protein